MALYTFSTYLKGHKKAADLPFIYEGITHIEDLSIEDFLFAVENFNKMIATQKLDGANLRVGIDTSGKFFTSRESKGGKRFYKVSDYPEEGAGFDGFKAAHKALEKVQKKIKSVLANGESAEIEILYRRQPNAITYGKDGLNYIAFLRMITDEGDAPDQSQIKKLNDVLGGDTVDVNSKVTDTVDGENIVDTEETSKWKFITPEKIDTNKLKSVNLTKEVAALKKFLNTKNKKAIAETDGELKTNYDVLSTTKKNLKDEKERLQQIVTNDFKLQIKETLLKNFVRNIKPSIQDDKLHPDEDLGIEGVVLLDPVTQKQFKIVDKDVFTTINSFNNEVRSNISGIIKSADPLAPLANRGGIFGDAKIRIVKILGIEGLSTSSNIKRTLKKFMGDSPEETVVNVAKSLHQLNFQGTKIKIEAILINTLKELEKALQDFKSNVDKYKKTLSTGKTVGYSPEIKRRTLLVFAETKRDISKLINLVKDSKDFGGIIVALFGRQIKDIHSTDAANE